MCVVFCKFTHTISVHHECNVFAFAVCRVCGRELDICQTGGNFLNFQQMRLGEMILLFMKKIRLLH